MGNAQTRSQITTACDSDCQKQNRIANTQAEYQRLSSDPNADPVQRQKAYESYMTALHGPAWKLQKDAKERATEENKRMIDPSNEANLSGNYEQIIAEVAKLEEQEETYDIAIEKMNKYIAELDADINKGRVYINTLRRAVQLKAQLG
jgi:hypothetical protein